MRRTDVAVGLRHFDILLRTTPAAAQEVMPQLTMAAMAPDGRAALRPYMRANNPWLSQFLAVAVDRLPRAAPLGMLLTEPGVSLPDTEMARTAYAVLTKRLAVENAYGIFNRLYPRLPGASAASLAQLNLAAQSGNDRGYAPAIWDFGEGSDRGGTPVQLDKDSVGIEFSQHRGR
ncbi:MAG: hypothetical protein HC788_00105 [Sphingopyxis sp.]|nr:hypothetical protein [Sphingopyxis sp.]